LNALPERDSAKLRDAIEAGGSEMGRTVLAALERTQSVSHARKRAEEFARTARRQLEPLPRSECRTILEGMTNWCVNRET
jgi:octaprenyl-diphosphate synthase